MGRFCIVCVLIFLAACSANEEGEEVTTIRIAAAISLQDVLQEIQVNYEKIEHVNLEFQFGGSGTLARQIEQGIDADIFLSSNINWMDGLEEKEYILKETREDIVSNELVLVTSERHSNTYNDISEIDPKKLEQVAIGNPESVPAGEYAREALQMLGMWRELEDKLILAKNVRQVMTYVETGNAPYGLVYSSDAQASEKLTVAAGVDPTLHTEIVYPGAVLTGTENKEEAVRFLQYLRTDDAQKVFKSFGFREAGN